MHIVQESFTGDSSDENALALAFRYSRFLSALQIIFA